MAGQLTPKQSFARQGRPLHEIEGLLGQRYFLVHPGLVDVPDDQRAVLRARVDVPVLALVVL